MNTLIYRHYLAPPNDKGIYAPDSGYSNTLQELDEPTGMAIDSSQSLYLSDKGRKTVRVFDFAGKQLNSIAALSPSSVFIDDRDRVIIANETNVIFAQGSPVSFNYTKENGKEEPLLEIRSAATNLAGDFFLVSGKLKGIQAYDQSLKSISGLSFSKMEREFVKVVVNARNQIYALDEPRKQLVVFDSTGKTIYGIGPAGKGFQFDRIDDFSLDDANHLYLLTKNPRGILIFSPAGALLKFIGSDKKSAVSFEDAKVIAVGPSGSIYVLDKGLKRILKLG